jgi:hypothetical protein
MHMIEILLLFVVLLAANFLVLSSLWILLLNLGVFEVPDESHWSKKLILVNRRARARLSWTVTLGVGGGAMSATPIYASFDYAQDKSIQSRVSFVFSGLATAKQNGVLSGYLPYSEPQIICEAQV